MFFSLLEKMKADMEATKEQMAAMMEAMMSMKKFAYQNKPFIMAELAKQVFLLDKWPQ